jgi:hypothetical protein
MSDVSEDLGRFEAHVLDSSSQDISAFMGAPLRAVTLRREVSYVSRLGGRARSPRRRCMVLLGNAADPV